MSFPRPFSFTSFLFLVRLALVVTLVCAATISHSEPRLTSSDDTKPYVGKLWVTVAELQASRMTPEMHTRLQRWASNPAVPVLSSRNDDGDVALLAATYLAVAQEDKATQRQLRQRIRHAMGSEVTSVDGRGDGESLALARNLPSLLIAANLLGLNDDPDVRRWARGLLHRKLGLQRRSIVSTHKQRPNNWGTHAGAARIAIALFLNDTDELARAAAVFHGWLGNKSAHQGFKFGRDLSWHARQEQPQGINPMGARINGYNVDGVLPDDQRRGGSFSWPPVREPYVWEALQGAMLQAQLLHDNGYPAFEWENKALLRATRWVIETAQYLPEGDDIWLLPLVDRAYNTSYSTRVNPSAGRPGKSIGFTRFTHPACASPAQ